MIRTRSPGSALVEEAVRVGADVIYCSTLHAPRSTLHAPRSTLHAPRTAQRIGSTAAYLLAKRPCRVVIETDNRLARPRVRAPV